VTVSSGVIETTLRARGVTLAGMNNGIGRASERVWRTTISDKTG
jgi:hypothetical protein